MTVKRYGSVLFDTGLIEMACVDYVTYSDYQKLVAERAATPLVVQARVAAKLADTYVDNLRTGRNG